MLQGTVKKNELILLKVKKKKSGSKFTMLGNRLKKGFEDGGTL